MLATLGFAVAAACLLGVLVNELADSRFGDFLERLMPDDEFHGNGSLPHDACDQDERSTL